MGIIKLGVSAAKFLFISLAILNLAFLPQVFAVGWAPSVTIESNSGTPYGTESSCANDTAANKLVCVYVGTDPNNSSSGFNLYYRSSSDGGVIWSNNRVSVADTVGDEYDPYITYDSTRGRLILIYSAWFNQTAGQGNGTYFRYGTFDSSGNLSWSTSSSIAAQQYHNYWDASLLSLSDGNILAFLTVEGPEGNESLVPHNGRIEYRKSTDGGLTWQTPTNPVVGPDTGMDEEQPVAVQNPDGAIRVLYRNRGYSNVGQLPGHNIPVTGVDSYQTWSTDEGQTWIGSSIFYQTPQDDLVSFVGSQGGTNQTVMMIMKNSAGYYAPYLEQSNDNGATFGPLTLVFESQVQFNDWENIDPGFAIGCKGFVANTTRDASLGTGQVYIRRYDWSTATC